MQQKKTGARKASAVKKVARRKPATARKSTPAAKPAAPTAGLTHEMIAKRAYEIWLTNIRRAYQPAQDWAEAEKQLRAELKKKPRQPRAAAPPTESKPDSRLAA